MRQLQPERRREWPSLRLIDTHAHLDELQDLEGSLVRAREAGVQAIVGVGGGLASNRRILQLASQFPGFILPAVGLHPWRLKEENLEANLQFIEREIPRCVALGEVGLDFAIETPRDQQEGILRRLLTIASREGKPVLLHARRAWGEALRLLEAGETPRAVFHWYSGPADVLQRIFDRGFFISATPAAAYSERHRKAIREAPLHQLLLETDAPEVYRGSPSEPKDVFATLRSVSEVRGRPPEEIAGQTFLNSLDFFKLPRS
jgi:TatD DNase family protein